MVYLISVSLSSIAKPGAFLVDSLPILKFLPTFLAPFKRLGKTAHEFEYNLFMTLLREITTRLDSGSAVADCFAKNLLVNKEDRDLTEEEGAYTCGTIFEAGSGTTSGALESLTMALLLYPEVQVEAQKELDAVCGDRLPQFEDADHLPYIKAVTKEALRWRPIVTQGIVHMSVKDDRYGDYFIPANTSILGNHW
jgi:cytochrome P450